MNYKFITDMTRREYEYFVKSHSTTSFMQEYGWPFVKSNWEHAYCGLYQNDTLVAACAVLIKKLPFNIRLFYVPRGYLIDYKNSDLLLIFTKYLKEFAKHKHAYAITIDPNFCKSETSILTIEKNETVSFPKHYSIDADIKHNNLINLHYHHKGFHKSINSYLQPRFNMSIPLVDENFEPLTEQQVKSSFKKRIREYLGNYHTKRGVFFEHTTDIDRLDEFMEIINITEERQNISLRNRAYFETMMKQYPDRAVLFFGKLDLKQYLEFLNSHKSTEEEKKEIESFIEEGKTTLTLSAALVLIPLNEEKVRTCEYLYAGNNLKFAKLNISYGLVYDICKYGIEQNCDFCNLGGINGTLDDHLTTFKSRFNAIVWEFYGEYDYIVNHFLYWPIRIFLPVGKWFYRKLRRR